MLAQGQRLVRPGLVQFDVRVSLAIIKWPIVPCFRSQAANRLEDLTACFSFGRQFNNHVTSILKAPIIKVDFAGVDMNATKPRKALDEALAAAPVALTQGMVFVLYPGDSILTPSLGHHGGAKRVEFSGLLSISLMLFHCQLALSALLGHGAQKLGARILSSVICCGHVGVDDARLLVSSATDHSLFGEIGLVNLGSRYEVVLDRNRQISVTAVTVRFLDERAVLTKMPNDRLPRRKLLMLENVFHTVA